VKDTAKLNLTKQLGDLFKFAEKSNTTTVKAIAYKSGAPDSIVASATYTIGSGPVFYNPSWTSRKAITIDHTKVSGSSSLINFPMLLDRVGMRTHAMACPVIEL
jgi:hypothetical protein